MSWFNRLLRQKSVIDKDETIQSVQPRFTEHDVQTAFSYLLSYAQTADSAPPYGTRGRTQYLRRTWRQEPILTGAVYSLVAKATAWPWTLTGGKTKVRRAQELLSTAEAGKGWSFFLSRAVLDFLTTNVGAVIEVGYADAEQTRIAGLFNVDAGRCELTGNARFPMRYFPPTGTAAIALAAHQVIQVCSLPLTDEKYHGRGYCAVERALRAARLLMLIHQYREEKLSNLPPQGIAAITGNLTDTQWADALRKYKESREGRGQLVFPGLLFLIADTLDIKLTPFSSLPENFDERSAVDIYAQTLALDFGVDVSEFWSIKQSGMTRPNTEIQHLKAKGKGPGEIMSNFSRALNFNVIPRGVEFAFGAQDADDVLRAAQVQQAQTDVIMSLYERGVGIIGVAEARDLAARRGVLPDDMIATDTTEVDDTEGLKSYMAEDIVQATFAPERGTARYKTLQRARHDTARVALINVKSVELEEGEIDYAAERARAQSLIAAWGDYDVDFSLPAEDAPVEITPEDIDTAVADVKLALEAGEIE